jgi:hypothetical protein
VAYFVKCTPPTPPEHRGLFQAVTDGFNKATEETKMTEKVANIYTALCAAQSAMGPVVKGAVNPHFKSKYADLADVMQVAIPALADNGIAVFHVMERDEDGGQNMTTVLVHGESGTDIRCPVPLIVQKNDMQGMKSATTYAKRIGIESLTGIAPEDDDGNAAKKSAPKNDEENAAAPQRMSAARANREYWPKFNAALERADTEEKLQDVLRILQADEPILPKEWFKGAIDAIMAHSRQTGIRIKLQEAAE